VCEHKYVYLGSHIVGPAQSRSHLGRKAERATLSAKYDSRHDPVFLRETTCEPEFMRVFFERLNAESQATELIGANSRNDVGRKRLGGGKAAHKITI